MTVNRQRFESLLRATGRQGVENVLAQLAQMGFHAAPASTRFHGCHEGGLLAHSLGVYDEAVAIREVQVRLKPEVAAQLPPDSIAIAALLHDVCKAEIYKLEKKWKKVEGKWESFDGYAVDYYAFPLGHGEKSVVQLMRWGLAMTDDEVIAIRWHMSGFDLAFQGPEIRANYGAATDKCPLLAVLKTADGLALHVMGV